MALSTMLLLDTIDSSSEDESNAACDDILKVATVKKEKPRFWISDHIKFRQERGEFTLFNDLSDEKFTNYFRMERKTFFEIKCSISQNSENTLGNNSTYHDKLNTTLKSRQKAIVIYRQQSDRRQQDICGRQDATGR